MAVFGSPVFTNEGRALIADIIANQGTAVFKEAWLSSTNYVGSEESLTAATFTGTFLVDSDISADIYNSDTIGTEVSVDNSTLLTDQNLYSIGIILDDNGTDVLLCVSTTSSPEPIPAFVDNPIKFAYQFMLTVSSTQNIQVVGSLAGVVYKSDIIDDLVTSAADKPLSAKQGKGLHENVIALENFYGSKNLNALPYYDGTYKSMSGVVYSVDSDGVISLANTATNASEFICHDTDLFLKSGTYILTGCPAGGNTSNTYFLFTQQTDSGGNSKVYRDTGNGVVVTVEPDQNHTDGAIVSIVFHVFNGCNVSGKKVYPMIRDARVVDNTWVAYAPTNREAMSFRANGKVGAKNLLVYPYYDTSFTNSNITFTDNGNGTVTVSTSGASTAQKDFWLSRGVVGLISTYLENGTYKLSGCPVGGELSTKYKLLLTYQNPSNVEVPVNDIGDGATFTINGSYGDSKGALVAVRIIVRSGTTIGTPIIFYPMIRIVEDTDETYHPYSKTNKQLTDDKAERSDLATLKLTGSTNTTGAQIDTGTFFYLNGSFCKALQNIAVNAAFTENTNYKKDTVGNLLVKTKEIQIPAGDFGTFPLNASGHAFPHTILDYTGIAKERIISIMQIDTYVVNGFFSYEMYGNGLYVMASKTDAGDYTYLNGANATLRIAYI